MIEAGAAGSLPRVSQEVLRVRVLGFPGGSDGKESVCSAGNLGSIPWRREWHTARYPRHTSEKKGICSHAEGGGHVNGLCKGTRKVGKARRQDNSQER